MCILILFEAIQIIVDFPNLNIVMENAKIMLDNLNISNRVPSYRRNNRKVKDGDSMFILNVQTLFTYFGLC